MSYVALVTERYDEVVEFSLHFNRLLDDNQKLLAQMRGDHSEPGSFARAK